MKPNIVIAAIVLLAVGGLTYMMFALAQVECSLCVTYQDHRHCSKAMGPDKAAATDEAHRNACALLAQGVTDSVNCGQAPAEELECHTAGAK
jgi:hypothetical protein